MATKAPKEFDRVMRRGQRPAPITPNAGRHLDSERMLEGALAIPIELVSADPDQPRKHFDQAGLRELADSIHEHGILQPLVVHRAGTLADGRYRYVVVAGGRRYAAAQLAGLGHVPVIVRASEGAHRRILQLTENLLREDLSPLEEARAMKEYMDLESIKDRRTLAERIHKSHTYVEERFSWLRYNDVAQALGAGVLSPTAATEVARVTHKRDREKLIKQAALGPVRRADVRRAKQHGGGHDAGSVEPAEEL
jgi:ParB family chromosome partitioning protein